MAVKKKQSNRPKSTIFMVVMGVIGIGIIYLLTSSPRKEDTCAGDSCQSEVLNTTDEFLGDKGISIEALGSTIYIDESNVSDGNMHSFNYYSDKQEKNIYFFVVKASDGTYRVAANACEVCFDAKRGFKQVGDLIQCVNCRTTYTKEQIATQKGGCNPGPIAKNAQVEDGRMAINVSDIEKVAYLF